MKSSNGNYDKMQSKHENRKFQMVEFRIYYTMEYKM